MNFLKDIVKRIVFFLGYRQSIDWNKRYRDLGIYSVYDSNTVQQNNQDKVTSDQTNAYADILNSCYKENFFLNILDFGCGIGRHFEFLSTLNNNHTNANIFGYDPTVQLLEHANHFGYEKLYTKPNFENEYDLIFCHMVLGGLSNKEADDSLRLMINNLKKGGIIFCVEGTSNKPRNHTSWRLRKVEDYMLEHPEMSWSLKGSVLENGECLSIIVGLKKL